jgi:murein DD-endopeptidase MepM/ murein hydrolase activator NlpD
MRLPLGWFRRRYTLLIIPEHSGASSRLRLTIAPFLLAGAVFGLLVASAIVLLALRSEDAHRIQALHEELAEAADAYEASLADREQSIAQLKSEVMRLTEEAGAVKQKLEELDRLEAEIEAIVEIALPGETNGLVSASSGREAAVAPLSYDGGVGGENHPVDTDGLKEDDGDGSVGMMTSLRYEAEVLRSRLAAKKEEAGRVLEKLRMLPIGWPTESNRITSEFGLRSDPFTRRLAKHSGIDIGGHSGDPVYAAGGGAVVESAFNRSRGHYIIIEHDSGYKSVYMHLRKRLASTGQKVEQGEEIGLLGSSGRSTGPHLHFEIWKNDQPVDPLPYLQLFKEENP